MTIQDTTQFGYLTFDAEWYDDLDDMHRDEAWRAWVIHSGPVTLDGTPAVIGGIRNDYATVSALPHGASYEWSWPAVARIMSNGGNFVS